MNNSRTDITFIVDLHHDGTWTATVNDSQLAIVRSEGMYSVLDGSETICQFPYTDVASDQLSRRLALARIRWMVEQIKVGRM